MKERLTSIQVYFYVIPPYGKQDKEVLPYFINIDDTYSFGSDFEKWIRVVKQITRSIQQSGLPLEIMAAPWTKPHPSEKTEEHENGAEIVNTASFPFRAEKDEAAKIFILLLSAKDFSTKQGSSNADKKLTKIINYFRHTCLAQEGEEILAEHAFDYQPIITVGVEDIMNLYSDDESSGDFRRDLNLDHRIKYLDSSIWNRYLPLHCDDQTAKSFEDRFMEILGQMVTWHREGLYQSVAAVTTLEFQTRMLYNSFIAKVGEKGHNELVRPFKFHSETQMRRKANEVMKFFEADRNGVTLKAMLKWNFLLVDDQAEKVPMTNIYNGHSSSVTKSRLIQEILKDDFPPLSISMEVPKQEIGIVDEMIDQLKPNNPIVFDVILLDYLLGLGKEREREYGHDFLLRLRKEPALQKGPYNRFWIFPISSFPHAFTDKLHQLGINHLTDWWHLSNGGDPVCAPELFRYNILEFLQQQVSICFYDESMFELIVKKFSHITNFTDWVRLLIRSVLHIQAFRDQLEFETGSSFSMSFTRFFKSQNPLLTFEIEFLDLLRTFASYDIEKDCLAKMKLFQSKNPQFASNLIPYLGAMLKNRVERLKIYIFYSEKDEDEKNYLEKIKPHLNALKRNYQIDYWYAKSVNPGENITLSTNKEITEASFFIFLISPDLFDSDEKNTEMEQIFSMNKSIFPVYCRPITIFENRLKDLQAVPLSGKPLSAISNIDDIITNELVPAIIKKIEGLTKQYHT